MLGQKVEPARLVMADVPLPLQPLQVGVVGAQPKGLVEHCRSATSACQQRWGWLEFLEGRNAPASLGCSRMAGTASVHCPARPACTAGVALAATTALVPTRALPASTSAPPLARQSLAGGLVPT